MKTEGITLEKRKTLLHEVYVGSQEREHSIHEYKMLSKKLNSDRTVFTIVQYFFNFMILDFSKPLNY
jgi:hypothetical protein